MEMPQQPVLVELVQKGEGQTLEFKKSLSLQREGLEALCAMVNSDLARGTLVFGIKPDGTVCGIEQGNLDTAQRSLWEVIRHKFDPTPIVQMEVEGLKGRQVIVVRAERYQGVAYYEYDGRAWIREGTSNRKLNLAEKEQLRKRRDRDSHPGPWKCDRCGSLVGVLRMFEISSEGVNYPSAS